MFLGHLSLDCGHTVYGDRAVIVSVSEHVASICVYKGKLRYLFSEVSIASFETPCFEFESVLRFLYLRLCFSLFS